MDGARAWLESGTADGIEPAKLGESSEEIAFKAIDHLMQIKNDLPPPSDLIAIAVDDMKVVTGLMKLVVVFGMYPKISGFMVPLAPRVSWPLPPCAKGDAQVLADKVAALFAGDDDLTSLLLVSPFMVDVFALLSVANEPQFKLIVKRLPTFNLYKLLIQLKGTAHPAAFIVTRTLGSLVVKRKDAVRTLLELFLEVELDKAAMALVSFQGTPKVYIEHLGEQLFDIVAQDIPKDGTISPLVESALVVISQLAYMEPQLLGKLRDLICDPFLIGGSVRRPANALLLTLMQGGRFAEHLFSRVVVSLWLLVCTSMDLFSVKLLGFGLEMAPKRIANVVDHLLITHLPGHLEWATEGEPHLVEHVRKPSDARHFIEQIGVRVNVLKSVLSYADDFTPMLIALMKQWAESKDPLKKVLNAKVIEALSTDKDLKKKLFNNPEEIVEFSFSIIDAREKAGPKLATLEIGDSDDEEDSENEDSENEDKTILEVCLDLMGIVLLEAQDYEVTAERKLQLKALVADKTLSKTIRARADFCYEILDGAARFKDDGIDVDDEAGNIEMAYAMLKEPLVPSRAYGIHLISKLLERRALTLAQSMEVFVGALQDDDSYIYLNGIKAIENAARVHPTAEVIEYLHPVQGLDASLRAREALTRLLTPGSMAKVSSGLIAALTKDLSASAAASTDIRIRISSASILSILIAQFPLSFTEAQQREVADCALGIFTHERSADVALIRAVTVLTLEIVNAINEGIFKLGDVKDALMTRVSAIAEETEDDTLRDLARGVLESS